ncbi:MAG TPA: VOC family protein [Flavobacteriales bacterium]|nr:VOC family protein [Flavobacteriales bacterium]
MKGAAVFLGQVVVGLVKLGVDLNGLWPDHLCYRVETQERYRQMLDRLRQEAEPLGENIVAGRPIATFRLHQPVRAAGYAVDVLELPAPKAGSSYREGFEHAEFVVPVDLETFMGRHPHLDWDTTGLGKAHNPELRLRLGAANAKFHRTPLADLVASERGAQA